MLLPAGSSPVLAFIILMVKTLAIIVPVLIAVAFFTVAERKIMGAIQRRRGPNVDYHVLLLFM